VADGKRSDTARAARHERELRALCPP